MLNESLDACSASINSEDEEGSWLNTFPQPMYDGMVEAAISWQRVQLTHAHVYKRDAIGDLRWPENIRQSEDIVWFIQFATATERHWRRLDEIVGVWYQHRQPRMSLDKPSGHVHEHTAKALFQAEATLKNRSALTTQRAFLISEALWTIAARAFIFKPLYWSKICLKANSINPKARPPSKIFSAFPFRNYDILIFLWATTPPRKIKFLIKGFQGWNYRRSI